MRRLIVLITLILMIIVCDESHAQTFNYHHNMQTVNLHDSAILLQSKENITFPANYKSVDEWQETLELLPQKALFGGKYWLVTELVNHTTETKFVLYPYNTVVSKIESKLYSEEGSIQTLVTGGEVSNEFAFHYGNSIRLHPNEKYYLVTSFESDFFYTPIKFVIKPKADFERLVVIENLIMILCFGVGLVLGLYNLLIYFGSKDKTHLYYALFAVCWVFAWSHFFHISDQLFGLYSPNLHWLGFALTPLTNILFYINLLKLKDTHPKITNGSLVLGVVAACGVPMAMLFPSFGFLWATIVTGSALCLGLYVGFLRISEGFKPARYFVLAYIAMAIPNMIGNLTNLGVLPPSSLNLYLLGLVGTALDALLLAFAVADKFRLTNLENIELNKNLELKVQQRTQELEDLASELRDASEAKSRFLANMSHEIRTPMTSIIGYADGMLLGDIKPSEKGHAINVILQNARHVQNLINDILDMSKIEANRLEVELIEADMFRCIAEIESLLGKQIRDKGLEFELNYHFPLPNLIVIDPTRFRQILLNLTSNALKFTSVGKICIDVSCNEEKLRISVRDTGIGMTKDEINSLFTAFHQADSSTTRRYGGTGLGLNISKNLARKLDGDISVESHVGSGTTFTLELGLYTTKDTQWVNCINELPQSKLDLHSVDTSESLKGKVLLAEDHPDNRKLITIILEGMGLQVVAAENGQEAVQAVLDHEFDLVLLDIQMPVMDGEEAFKFIHATGVSAPILALTANTMTHEVERYLKMGFTDHLSKPIDRTKFHKKISHYLNLEVEELNLPIGEFEALQNNYLQGLEEQKDLLHSSFESSDFVALKRHVHAIKGTAGMFECHEIHNYATQLDELLKSGSLEGVDVLLDLLVNAMSDASKAIMS